MTDDNKGQKQDAGKPQLSLLPYAPLCAVAEVLAYGCEKYSKDNWQHVPEGRQRYIDALLRHAHAYAYAYADGETHDDESGLHHLAHAACNALFVIWFDTRGARCK
ncbi:dATP/dGTP diphosphohydrolase domain-containing protein [Psychrobacter pygoscelis]|uniref:dATP/dGTP diphosphohydrolase domain-containing protein n=1 Tax=Psychrobacter pygoscelis TaxID=2488563 RepID=UPI00103BE91B|nr:dATP/dGTP diphosphohydrolase domain-containing protein [Psychrobacter pygoscelis]